MVKCYDHDKMWCVLCIDTRTKKLWKLAQEKMCIDHTFLSNYDGISGMTSHFKLVTTTSPPETDTLHRMMTYLFEEYNQKQSEVSQPPADSLGG